MTAKRRSRTRFLSLLALQAGLLALGGCTSGPADDPPAAGGGKVLPPVHVAAVEQPDAPPAPAEVDADGTAGAVSAAVETAGLAPEAPDRSATEEGPATVPACEPGVDHRAAGREAWRAGDRETAARELRCAVEGGAGDAADTYLLGLALWKTGDLDGAAEALAAAAWELDDPVRALVNLARVRIELGDVPGARKAVRDALDRSGEDPDAWNVLGRVLLAAGDRDGAAEAFTRAADLDPDNPWPRNNLGYLYLVTGEADRAVGPLEEAVALDAGLAPAWHNLALARERAGDLPGALEAARRAAGLSGEESYRATAARLAALVPVDGTEPGTREAAGGTGEPAGNRVAAVSGTVPGTPAEPVPLPRVP